MRRLSPSFSAFQQPTPVRCCSEGLQSLAPYQREKEFRAVILEGVPLPGWPVLGVSPLCDKERMMKISDCHGPLVTIPVEVRDSSHMQKLVQAYLLWAA